MKTVMITGAGSGIGRELALQYRKDGWNVIGVARSEGQLAELRHAGIAGEFADMGEVDSLKALAERLQGRSIDVLILAAGIIRNRHMKITEIDVPAWEETFRINSIAPAVMAGLFLPNLRKGDTRKLVALTSGRASIANNNSGSTYIYRASKTALNAIWRNISVEEPDINALLVHPGRVRTKMGSPDSELSVEESAESIRQVVANAGPEASGRYWAYDGRELPW